LTKSGTRVIPRFTSCIFNYSEALLDVPPDVQLHTSDLAVGLLTALYFHLM